MKRPLDNEISLSVVLYIQVYCTYPINCHCNVFKYNFSFKENVGLQMVNEPRMTTVRYESPQSTKKFSVYYQKPLSHFKIFITTCTSIDIIKYENQIAFNVKMSMFHVDL